MLKKLLLSTTICCALSVPAMAEDSGTLKAALIDDSKVGVEFRYRFEHVDQDAFAEDAAASTLRSALHYKTGSIKGFSGTAEVQNVLHLGEDNFNDSVNGKTTYPTVADPELTEITQAYVSYDGFADTSMSVGRKTYNLDNMRFMNKNNWRQHHQSLDSVHIKNQSLADTTLQYIYGNKLHRSNGGDHPLGSINTNIHMLNAKYSGWDYGSLTGYSYWLDFDNASFAGNSSKTYGLRFTGSAPVSDSLKVLYTAEYATQSDHGDNTSSYDADYQMAELGIGGKNWSVKGNYEVLEADGTKGRFTAPLGTGHGFHGWADQFVAVPTNGIEDKNIKFSYKVESPDTVLDGLKFDARYHDFDAEDGGADYGSEIDLKLSKSFADNYSVSLIYADYNSDTFSSDTQKAFVILGAKF